MKPVTRNLIANYIGRSWALLINFIATPLLISLLGIESYGLIGFYTTLYGLINLLDFGVSPTINRELAQYSVDPTQSHRGRDLVRTLEIGYWFIGLILGVIVYFGAPVIAENWLQSYELSSDVLIHSIRLMGFLVVLEWPFTFYQGALLGMQRHVILNVINITNSLLKFGGALLILKFVSPTIDAFFTWQMFISTIVIIVEVITVWRCLPATHNRPSIDLKILERVWKFALSLNLISFLGLAIHQLDKVLVSHLFTLDTLGYYNLATMVSGGFTILVSPVYMTYFPKMSTLVAQKDEDALRKVYHQSCQLVSAAILPAATIGAFFAEIVIRIWTGDPTVAEKTAPIATLLIIGTAINALASMPYEAQISHGWTGLSLTINIISLPLVAILILLLNQWFGINGVSGIWIVYNLGLLLISVPIMHNRILQGEFGNWFHGDVLIPLATCLAFAGVLLAVQNSDLDIQNSVPALVISAFILQLTVLFLVPFTREKLINLIGKVLHRQNHAI
jgi:O-antigen/teichoic acid export membrane protein